jgi:hypothetical protein
MLTITDFHANQRVLLSPMVAVFVNGDSLAWVIRIKDGMVLVRLQHSDRELLVHPRDIIKIIQ